MENLKATELRIGNLVYNEFTREQMEVYPIMIHQLSKIGSTNIKPILLTEEWLLKFGFHRHHADYSNDVIYIKNIDSNNGFEWGVYPNELGSGIEIKNRILLRYVHQLQNLYFALIGEELTFKIE